MTVPTTLRPQSSGLSPRSSIRSLPGIRAILGFTLAAVASAAFSQAAFPSHPIKVIVPFAAGSGVDAVARMYAERLGERTKTQFIVENRDGAGGTLGTVAVARSPADGYTLLFTASPPYAVGSAVQGNNAYDPAKDFTFISKVAATPMVLIASTGSGFTRFDDLVTEARAHPGKLNYASTGIGTPSHLSVEIIKQRMSIAIEPIHYKSAGQALTDTIGNTVPLYMPSYPAAQGQLQAGKVVGLAIGSPTRLAAAPDIPTLAEVLKQPGLEIRVWYGFLAPKGTSKAIVDKIAADVAEVSALPDTAQRIGKLGAEPLQVGPTEFASQVAAEVTTGLQLVQQLGIAQTGQK
ncbi:tripartite tricarboxylate transporter substrate binding protein [soil metagenome]